MSDAKQPPPRLTPDESRLIDGLLSGEAARRVERQVAADPGRRDAMARERAALGLWVEDARRARLDEDALTARVLAAVEDAPQAAGRGTGGAAGRRWGEVLSPRAAITYAAAAVLLIGVGLAGTFLVQQQRNDAVASPDATARPVDPDVDLLDGVRYAVESELIRAPQPTIPATPPAESQPGARPRGALTQSEPTGDEAPAPSDPEDGPTKESR